MKKINCLEMLEQRHLLGGGTTDTENNIENPITKDLKFLGEEVLKQGEKLAGNFANSEAESLGLAMLASFTAVGLVSQLPVIKKIPTLLLAAAAPVVATAIEPFFKPAAHEIKAYKPGTLLSNLEDCLDTKYSKQVELFTEYPAASTTAFSLATGLLVKGIVFFAVKYTTIRKITKDSIITTLSLATAGLTGYFVRTEFDGYKKAHTSFNPEKAF